MNEELIFCGWLWVILSLPATRVIFNVLAGRKRFIDHDVVSVVLSTPVLCIGLLMAFAYALTVVTMQVIA